MTKTIHIEGMTCGHCAMHVKNALSEVCGVKNADVKLQDKLAVIELAHEVDNDKLIAAVSEAGYKVTNID